ncbi:MAG: Gfo/Idh/MocA family protein, partial [Verrucomicrobiales bacterium]
MKRRDFVKVGASASAASAASIFGFQFVPSTVWGANDRINIGCVGIGGKGNVDTRGAAGAEGSQIVALCDVADPNNHGLERKGEPGNPKSRMAIVEDFPQARFYFDYREMIADHPELDAVTVSTPDHHHMHASVLAMRKGMHVYCQKPLSHSIWEARFMAQEARKAGVVTNMGNQSHAGDPMRRAVELVRAGLIGDVGEVHVWTNRPIWPQGIEQWPTEEKVPPGMNWDLWCGPAPTCPYSKEIAPFNWRGYWNYGTGALGDMACHIMDMAYWALELGAPDSVEAESGGMTEISGPNWSKITYQFPARGDKRKVKLVWYDGKKDDDTPNLPPEGILRGEDPKSYGSILRGKGGTLYYNRGNNNWVVKPTGNLDGFEWPEPSIERAPDRDPYKEWIAGIKGGPTPLSNFEHAGPFTETVLLGNLAVRLGRKIEWDSENLRAVCVPEADALIRREYRAGWEIS